MNILNRTAHLYIKKKKCKKKSYKNGHLGISLTLESMVPTNNGPRKYSLGKINIHIKLLAALGCQFTSSLDWTASSFFAEESCGFPSLFRVPTVKLSYSSRLTCRILYKRTP